MSRYLKYLFLIILFSLFSYNYCYGSVENNLKIAKIYEGNFYSHYLNQDWCPFSDDGCNLGEPLSGIEIPSDLNIEYYKNNEEDYIIQYLRTDYNMCIAIWKNGELETLLSSKG